ncbi:hypothetical protein [Coprococcus sp. AF21-14LB]|uniref:hypothetical protein n=1 Tax=Coprococcus sp. AF21-14LB TaxID=2292231 RepID=UPI000E50813B|nr:hypothetical protein [Coprococcus sp. AF21-14LB]RGS82310.1 hypothetical protein DWX73_01200 [Coprococcus sp. AF21-14LB]
MRKIKRLQKFAGMILMLFFTAGALTACGKAFDAKGFVEAKLDQMFQGDVTKALTFTEKETKADLEKEYETEIISFVDRNIIGGMQVSEGMRNDFIEVCRQIFLVMRYEVTEVEETGKHEYEVSVEYEPVDVFPKFVAGVQQDSEEIMQKAKNGEYKGTEKEINEQMQTEFIRHSYELLNTYWKEISYGEEKTLKVTVARNEKKEYAIADEDLDELIVKILRLDEIQD